MSELPRWARDLRYGAKKRAAHKGMEFTLTADDMAAMAERAAGACELTGIPFDFAIETKWKRRPWAPSLDRKNSGEGYTPDNVRLVCVAVNYAMNAWGEDVLREIAHGMLGLLRDNRKMARAQLRSQAAGLRGVTKFTDGPRHKPFRARITHAKKTYELGMFASESEAHAVYQEAAEQLARGIEPGAY